MIRQIKISLLPDFPVGNILTVTKPRKHRKTKNEQIIEEEGSVAMN